MSEPPPITATVPPPVVRPAPPPPRARTLGRYELVTPIGSGGMADVWLGRFRGHGDFVRLCALKLLRAGMAASPRERQRFLREAQIAAGIHHANVVDVIDVGEEDGILYQAMSLVDGDSFSSLLRARAPDDPLPLGVTLSIVVDALRGLHAAHEWVDGEGVPRPVVHRDVSPQNILIGIDGVARLSDFGIAHVFSNDDDSTHSRIGKCPYFAPEQVRREKLDRRSDVFAMGIVLWEALTGTRLFKGADALETLDAVCHREIPDPRTHVPSLPADIAHATMKALARDREERHPSAAAMADALIKAGVPLERERVSALIEALAGERVRAWQSNLVVLDPAAATEVSPPPPLSSLPPRKPRRWIPWLAGLGVVATAGALLGVVRTGRHVGRSDDPATAATTAASAAGAEDVPASEKNASLGTVVSTASPSEPVPAAPAGTAAATSPASRHAAPARKARAPRPPFPDNPFKSR